MKGDKKEMFLVFLLIQVVRMADMCTSKPDFTKSKKHNGFDGLKLRINRGLSLRFVNIYLISSPSIKGSIISLLSAQTKVIFC
jgi:hypothetical protein